MSLKDAMQHLTVYLTPEEIVAGGDYSPPNPVLTNNELAALFNDGKGLTYSDFDCDEPIVVSE